MQTAVATEKKNKGGRPRKIAGGAVTVSYTLSPDLATEIAVEAKRRGISASEIVRAALGNWLDSSAHTVS